MATEVKHRRGTTAQCDAATPALGELIVDTTLNQLRVGDGSTVGGHKLQKQRTITGTTNQITVSNGDGVSGDPTLSLPQNINFTADVIFNSVTCQNGAGLRAAGNPGNTLTLAGYNGSSYVALATITSNATPTIDLITTATIGSAYIYRAGGTKIPNSDLATMSDKTIKGNASGSTAVPSDLTPAQINSITACGIISSTVTVDFNSGSTDNAITIVLPTGVTKYQFNAILINSASATLASANFGVFTSTGGGGTAIVSAGTATTVTTASDNTNNNMQNVSITNVGTTSWAATTIYFRVGTASASPATAKVTVSYRPLY
jgi:hypothetical protein